MNVAVLGASAKPDRYSYKAVKLLDKKGHRVFPVNPGLTSIDGAAVYSKLDGIPEPFDTVSVYLSAARSSEISEAIVNSVARRVIFNPGSENPGLAAKLREAGKTVVDSCTLVLLKTGQF